MFILCFNLIWSERGEARRKQNIARKPRRISSQPRHSRPPLLAVWDPATPGSRQPPSLSGLAVTRTDLLRPDSECDNQLGLFFPIINIPGWLGTWILLLEILKNNKREIGRENWSSKDGRVLYRCNKSLETKDATKDVSLLISFMALFFYSCVYKFLLITIGKSIVNAAIDTILKNCSSRASTLIIEWTNSWHGIEVRFFIDFHMEIFQYDSTKAICIHILVSKNHTHYATESDIVIGCDGYVIL